METDGPTLLRDPALVSLGVLIAFAERTGGASVAPYASLDLAAHVGDDPRAVDENRRRLLGAAGLADAAARLTTAEQVHGDVVTRVDGVLAGSGASAMPGTRPPVRGADALWTDEPSVPLVLLFADCVPVALVAPASRPAVAVVHAGWRGALAGLPALAARAIAQGAGVRPEELLAYVGPHVCPECYEVSVEIAAAFRARFPLSAPLPDRVDLGAAVEASLAEAGVPRANLVSAGVCTATSTERFFSYRAEGTTGRHAALAVVLGRP